MKQEPRQKTISKIIRPYNASYYEHDYFNFTCTGLVVFTIKFEVPYVFPAAERGKQYATELFILYANSVTKRFFYSLIWNKLHM